MEGGDLMALSEEAWKEMFEELSTYLRVLAGKLIGQGLRQDLYDKTIAGALRDRVTFRGETPAAMKSWLTGIMRNDAKDLGRSRDRAPVEVSLDDSSRSGPSLDALLGGLVARATGPQTSAAVILDLARALGMLPEFEGRCLLLHEVEELTAPEIAQRLGTPESTVKKAIQRARRRVREHLERARS
jgi:RNA polymerase sigma factor (sigma-70 family)